MVFFNLFIIRSWKPACFICERHFLRTSLAPLGATVPSWWGQQPSDTFKCWPPSKQPNISRCLSTRLSSIQPSINSIIHPSSTHPSIHPSVIHPSTPNFQRPTFYKITSGNEIVIYRCIWPLQMEWHCKKCFCKFTKTCFNTFFNTSSIFLLITK